jgi:hypothetical protein
MARSSLNFRSDCGKELSIGEKLLSTNSHSKFEHSSRASLFSIIVITSYWLIHAQRKSMRGMPDENCARLHPPVLTSGAINAVAEVSQACNGM